MRTHKEIIEDGGGWRGTRDKLGMAKSDTKVKFWYFRGAIPCEYWLDLDTAGLATLDELAKAAARRLYLKTRTVEKGRPGRPRKAVAA